MPHAPIDRYGVIGDCDTVALVGTDGSIDFMCFPYFDSPSIFARLLDEEKGGSFQLHPSLTGARQKQLYLPDTNILFTRFLAGDGVAEISDFMDIGEGAHRLVRRVKAVRGEIPFRMICAPRFDYARASHRVNLTSDGALFVSEGQDRCALRLRTFVPLDLQDGAATAEFVLRTGDTATFVLEDAAGDAGVSADPTYAVRAFKETHDFWRYWLARSTYRGRWREVVDRSALVLKLLTSRRYGSIVAAPTFGLPEQIGGARNWDYRYTWIRDGSFTLYGLMRLGYTEEAGAFMKWIEARCAELNPTARSRSCTGSTGATSSPSRPSTTWTATWGRGRCASATPPAAISSSTSTAS